MKRQRMSLAEQGRPSVAAELEKLLSEGLEDDESYPVTFDIGTHLQAPEDTNEYFIERCLPRCGATPHCGATLL